MTDCFFSESQELAKKFIKTIAFIDDETTFNTPNESAHILDANKITKHFAAIGTSCTFFKIEQTEEIKDIITLANTSDVIILDWKLTITSQSPEDIPEEEAEEDYEDPSGRGKYALQLVRDITNSSEKSPKLILIYTAEIDFQPIFEALQKQLPKDFTKNKEDLSFQNKCFRIKIAIKPTQDTSDFSEASKYRITYNDLPNLISSEFTRLTNGLVSNVALSAITTLRENSNKLLQKCNPKLDPAYLAHRAMSPRPEDAELLLHRVIIDSIDSILFSENIARHADFNSIGKWIDDNEFLPSKITIKKIKGLSLAINKNSLKKWQEEGYQKFFSSALPNPNDDSEKNKLKAFFKYNLREKTQSLFVPKDQVIGTSHEDFAILTHQKNIFYNDKHKPSLSLGTVIAREGQREKGEEKEFFLCIQQPCDSVRIKDSKPRSFLFLPLKQSPNGQGFSIIYKNDTPEYLRLKELTNPFDLKTISFHQTRQGVVFANNKVFTDVNGNQYQWLLDLKDSHAQKIANDFAAKISRVGINESEWLRRS